MCLYCYICDAATPKATLLNLKLHLKYIDVYVYGGMLDYTLCECISTSYKGSSAAYHINLPTILNSHLVVYNKQTTLQMPSIVSLFGKFDRCNIWYVSNLFLYRKVGEDTQTKGKKIMFYWQQQQRQHRRGQQQYNATCLHTHVPWAMDHYQHM